MDIAVNAKGQEPAIDDSVISRTTTFRSADMQDLLQGEPSSSCILSEKTILEQLETKRVLEELQTPVAPTVSLWDLDFVAGKGPRDGCSDRSEKAGGASRSSRYVADEKRCVVLGDVAANSQQSFGPSGANNSNDDSNNSSSNNIEGVRAETSVEAPKTVREPNSSSSSSLSSSPCSSSGSSEEEGEEEGGDDDKGKERRKKRKRRKRKEPLTMEMQISLAQNNFIFPIEEGSKSITAAAVVAGSAAAAAAATSSSERETWIIKGGGENPVIKVVPEYQVCCVGECGAHMSPVWGWTAKRPPKFHNGPTTVEVPVVWICPTRKGHRLSVCPYCLESFFMSGHQKDSLNREHAVAGGRNFALHIWDGRCYERFPRESFEFTHPSFAEDRLTYQRKRRLAKKQAKIPPPVVTSSRKIDVLRSSKKRLRQSEMAMQFEQMQQQQLLEQQQHEHRHRLSQQRQHQQPQQPIQYQPRPIHSHSQQQSHSGLQSMASITPTSMTQPYLMESKEPQLSSSSLRYPISRQTEMHPFPTSSSPSSMASAFIPAAAAAAKSGGQWSSHLRAQQQQQQQQQFLAAAVSSSSKSLSQPYSSSSLQQLQFSPMQQQQQSKPPIVVAPIAQYNPLNIFSQQQYIRQQQQQQQLFQQQQQQVQITQPQQQQQQQQLFAMPYLSSAPSSPLFLSVGNVPSPSSWPPTTTSSTVSTATYSPATIPIPQIYQPMSLAQAQIQQQLQLQQQQQQQIQQIHRPEFPHLRPLQQQLQLQQWPASIPDDSKLTPSIKSAFLYSPPPKPDYSVSSLLSENPSTAPKK